MKKVILLAVFVLSLTAWKSKSADYTLISGVITNKTEDFKIVSRDQSFSKTLKISADGHFQDTLRVKEGIYYLLNGKNYALLYVENGNDIKINADASDFYKTLKFSGKGSEICGYLLRKDQIKKDLIGPDQSSVYKLEETAFKAKFKEIKDKTQSVLVTSKGIPAAYAAKETRNIQYAYFAELEKYEKYHEYYTPMEGFKVSKDFLNDLAGLKLDNLEDFKFSEEYKKLLVSHYEKKASELEKTESIDADIALLKTYSTISNPLIRNQLLFESAEMGITYAEDLETYYKIFMGADSDEQHKNKITKTYNELVKVSKGRPSPKFAGYENNAGGTTSLESLKGKFVYIDVWATWCGPCKAEIPFLQKMEEKYHDKNIVFVSISVDKAKAHDKWKEMIEKQKMGGIQLIADKSFDSQFIKDYLIMAIPRFILIDPQGNIVSSNAPRPSDEAKLTSLFTKLGI
ncbi:TlpA family protein disulfide reductase [Flavobacterium luteolum]|uniref:TlpA family protein disulfide reductase n=1 Tax=Flavobacterium luteolum TaxID=3003259 RepID=UPI00248E8019|nr:TlpA disulfide reductase family protein [Flavobacterium luteolum]